MLRSFRTLITLLLGGAFATVIMAQEPPTPLPLLGVPCSSCHTCEKPTLETPCLRGCTRAMAAAIAAEFKERVPDVVILDELEDLYLPVPFDHKGHSEMAKMTIGCAICHHYTPEDTPHPACKSCHEVSPVREDMRKPSLKAAYHRQCLGCHREWSHQTACEICHPPKAGRGTGSGATRIPTVDDIVGTMHPPIPEPDAKVYQTKYKDKPGTRVLFRHKEHVHRFGFTCAECHREDSCSRCHEEGKSEADRVKTLEEHHNACATCHDMETPEKCNHCHRSEGEPVPKPFDHGDTGWALNRYHKGKSCRLCHKTVPFTKLDRDCNKCHGDWEPDEFDHAVTGQVLDENHADVDCGDCHADRRFDRAPSCDECHDEEVSFPAQRPGPVVTPKTPAND